MRLRLLFCICSLLISLQNNAQQFSFNSQQFTAQSGFKNIRSITDVKADKEGYLWIVSFNSIHKYDSHKFKKLNTSNVNSAGFLRFYESTNGKKYVIDLDGMIFFIEADSLRAYPYNHLLKTLNKRNRFKDVDFDKEDRLHISYVGSGYCVVDNGKLRYPFTEKGIKLSGFVCLLREDKVPFVFMKNDGLKTPSNEQYYYLFDEQLNLIDKRVITKNAFRYHPSVVTRFNGNYLLSSGLGNMLELNREGFLSENQYEEPILDLLMDKDEGLWVSTTTGTNYYEEGNLENNNPIVLNKGEISIAAAQDYEGGIWLYVDNTLQYIAQPRLKMLNKQNSIISDNNVVALEQEKDKLHIVSYGTEKIARINLSDFNGEHLNLDSLFEEKNIQAASNHFNDLYYDSTRDKMWLASRGNLYCRRGESWSAVSMKKLERRNGGTIYNFCRELYDSPYSLVGFYNSKFFLIEEDTVSYVSQKFPKLIVSMLLVKDSIFISTLGGLYLQVKDSVSFLGDKFPELKSPIYFLTYFDKKVWVSLPGHGLFILSEDSLEEVKYKNLSFGTARLLHYNSNELWIINNQGNFLFDARENELNQTRQLEAFKPCWLRGARINALINEEGLFQGTRDQGLGVMKWAHLKKDALSSPRLLFSQLKINGKEHESSNSNFELAYDESFIQISYVGISYRNNQIIYQHRMLGLEEDWTETDEDYLQFTTLPAGKYSFEVRCKRKGQLWGKSQVLHFTITPPFWQSWWFILLAFLFLVLVVYQIVNYRFKIVQREKSLLVSQLRAEQKALRAQMSPHFIFNIIASIRYTVNTGSKEKVNQFLDLFSSSMRNILNQANENHTTIENEINFIREYIEMERFRLEDSFDYELRYEQLESQLDKFIPPFIIQPFVENAIQHGLKNKEGNGLLEVYFKLMPPFLKVSVKDNGIGRDKASFYRKKQRSKSEQSLGIQLIKERLALHNGKKNNVNITDLVNEQKEVLGTLVEIDIRILDKIK